jgi:hypothetical protein
VCLIRSGTVGFQKKLQSQKKMDVLKGEEGKRVASGARHFRPTSGERLCRVP